MNVAALLAAPVVLLASLVGGPAPARPAADDSDAIVMTATTGTKILVESSRPGMNVASLDVSAAPGKTLTGLTVTAGDGAPACGTIPATVSGSAKVHCEHALPGLKDGERKVVTVTATADVDGKRVTRHLDFDVAALRLDAKLRLNGEERADAVVGRPTGGLKLAPSTAVAAELELHNPTAGPVTVSVAGWACPKSTLGAGESTTCTRAWTSPTRAGLRSVLDAVITVKDAEGRIGAVRRHGAVETVTTGSLATTGLPVLPTLATGIGMIAAGLALTRWSRRR